MAGTNGSVQADVYANMIERIRKGKAEEYYQKSNNNITRLIPDGNENVQISGRNYWTRFQTHIGGTFGFVSRDGGAWLKGSGSLYDRFQSAVKEFQYVQKLTDRVKDETSSAEVAAENEYKKLFKQGMEQLNEYRDILFHNDGSGKLTAGASATATVSSKTTYTFAKATDYIGLQRVLEGMALFVFDSDSTTQLYNSTAGATEPAFVEKIDRNSGVVSLNMLINSGTPGTGDFLTFTGLASAASFANFSGGFTSPAVSPDSSVHGLYYFNDVNTSNYMDGKLKSSYPQIIPSRIDGTGTTYSGRLALGLVHKIAENWGDAATKGLIALAPRAQFDALLAEQMQVMVVNNETVTSKYDDRIPSEMEGPRPSAVIAGIKHYADSRQYRNRVDFINPSRWGRVKTVDIQPMTDGDGRTVWRPINSSGQRVYALEAGWEGAMNYVCFAPGMQGYIDNLSIASGYKA